MLRSRLVSGGLALIVVGLIAIAGPAYAAPGDHPKLDGVLNQRANLGVGQSRVILVFNSEWEATAKAKELGGKLGRRLNLIRAQVIELSNGQLKQLADHPSVQSIHHDRPFESTMSRVAVTTGAREVQRGFGLTGAGVGVAVIDSGVTSWHDDLQYSGSLPAVQTNGGQRVAAFVDFVNGRLTPYDDNGHGTHVSGIIGGNGFDSRGASAGMAPDAHIVSLKVLDANGRGVISNVIAALEYVVANKYAYNIRVANLSVGAPVTESYKTDPLTLAAKRAVDAGIVVVTAAGNLGRNALGQPQYGGITAPGNAPWVLTVGASDHQGTVTRVDDVVAPYSSRGPSAIDHAAKPDVLAHGTGIVSMSARESLFYSTKSAYLLDGKLTLAYKPYLTLSGTSMAAPMVAGTAALMIQANPNLTPNLVKALLQYTAQEYAGYNALTQGAGFLNARGAVDMARYFATALPGQAYPYKSRWSRKIIWGNHRLSGGAISPSGNAWALGTVWGASREEDGDNIVWGTLCETDDCFNIVWGTVTDDGFNIVWGTVDDDGFNIVWGTGEDDGFNIVWGTGEDEDNIVWGTDCGGEDCFNIVWGTFDAGYNIVWGTAEAGYNIVWGTAALDGVVWSAVVEQVMFPDPLAEYDSLSWDALFAATTTTTTTSTTTTTTSTVTTTTTTLLGGLQ